MRKRIYFILCVLLTLSTSFYSCDDETPIDEIPNENTKPGDSTDNENGDKDNDKDENDNTTAEITIKDNIIDFGMNSEEKEISFTSSKDWSLIVETGSNDKWCSVTPTSGKAGESIIKVKVTENTTLEDRKATIEIKAEEVSKEITINQKAKGTIIISPNNVKVNSDESTIEIEVSSNIEFTQEIQVDWIKEIAITEKDLTKNKKQYLISANTTNSDRTGYVVFSGDNDIKETLTIIQNKRIEKRIVKYTNTYGGGDEIVGELTFSNNRLSKFELYYSGSPREYEIQQTITYNGNQIIMSGLVNSYNCTQTYSLNENGYATSCISEYSYETGWNQTKNTTFKYSNDGYLLSYDLVEDNDKYSCEFKYENNNITSIIEKYNNSISDEYKFYYTTNTNNKSKILNPFYEEALFNYLTAYYAGILGEATEYLPDSYYDGVRNGTIKYEIDNDGYISKMSQKDNENDSNYIFDYQNIE